MAEMAKARSSPAILALYVVIFSVGVLLLYTAYNGIHKPLQALGLQSQGIGSSMLDILVCLLVA